MIFYSNRHAYIEAFNSELQQGCLNATSFMCVADARLRAKIPTALSVQQLDAERGLPNLAEPIWEDRRLVRYGVKAAGKTIIGVGGL